MSTGTDENITLLRTILARLDTVTNDNRELRETVDRLSAADTQGAHQQRHVLIQHSRASVRGDPTVLPAGSLTPATTFRRRLTRAEELTTPQRSYPTLGVPPSAASEPEHGAATSDDDNDEKQIDSPSGAPPIAKPTGPWKTNDKGFALLIKKLDPPPMFTGSPTDTINDVRRWVVHTDEYLDIHLGVGVEGGRFKLVIQWTEGPPKDWLMQKRKEVATLVQRGHLEYEAEWKEIKHEFVELLEGPQYRLLQRAELEKLRLGQRNCKTPLFLNSEFDRLAVRLWPSGTDLAVFDFVLGDEYGKIIERSDLSLWEDIHRGLGIPQTLADWKAKTATAWAARQVVTRGRATLTPRGNFHRQGGYGRGVTTTDEKTTVNQVQARAGENEDETVTSDELPDSGAQLQRVQAVTNRQGDRTQTPQKKPGLFLTDDEVRKLMAAGRCFRCYQKGHVGSDPSCPGRGKPRRKPTAEELGKA
jgi:hypothetical protein